jgi:hypothetical protein
MRATAIAAPIVAGKTEDWREFCEEIHRVHRHAYEESRRHAGITREIFRLQRTAQGDIAIMYIEAEDPQEAFREIGRSDRPFDRWFREWILECHGLDLTHSALIPEDVFDWRAESGGVG